MLAPLLFSTYTVDQLITQALIFGIVAMSLVFLASYGGMVSLAQTAIFGISGFVFGNITTTATKGMNLGYSPWVGILPGARHRRSGIGLIYGGLASRSLGIYFLMITLIYAVIANVTFAQIEKISGFGGISGIVPPSIIGTPDAHPHRLYYLTLVLALLLYAGLRYLIRTPVRRRAPGRARRARAHELARLQRARSTARSPSRSAQFVALGRGPAVRVVERARRSRRRSGSARRSTCSSWPSSGGCGASRARSSARSRSCSSTTAWPPPTSRSAGFKLGTFNSLVGLIFLVIVLVSPDGLLGIWERGTDSLLRRPCPPPPPPAD